MLLRQFMVVAARRKRSGSAICKLTTVDGGNCARAMGLMLLSKLELPRQAQQELAQRAQL